ncbi:DUF255 domain-containing protein [Polaribacter sp. WD7]|uniref:thioredoxin family protein n=1 Tax=Polaribacter sp. WD7 TaxID=2269061 RepID=UPI000DF4665D|nr:thioredoxin family protein [Polaribacter sp. WD7]RCS27777.1 DUF255 domain-containing protein [Polaribacter sp. WD7]
MKNLLLVICVLILLCSPTSNAQEPKINWLTFEQLEDSLRVQKKKVFISFNADWCVFCKKMKKTSFKNKTIISILNKEYYAVEMNAESKDTIVFDGVSYINENLGKSRRPTHQIPLLLASRNNKPFSLPVHIFLDKNFKITQRYFEYLSPKKLIEILSQ